MFASARPSQLLSIALLAACVALLAVHPLAAQPSTNDAAHALTAIRDADPLELARVARRCGDDVVLRLLDPAQPLATRIAAIRATPWLGQPEDALPPLAAAITSSDGDLAEAAARALLAVAQKLDAAALTRRERDARELASVVATLRALQAQSWIRADLRALAAGAGAQLEALGVPAPPQD